MAMNSKMAMMIATEARRRRDERGRYMDGQDMTNRRSEMGRAEMRYNEGRSGRDMEMGGEGYFVWDRGGEENWRNERPGEQYRSPHGEQPEVYKRRDQERSGRMMADTNIVDLDRYSHYSDPLNQRKEPQKGRQIGFQSNNGNQLDKQAIMEWVENMEDDDGVIGGKYSWHQAQQYAHNMGITGEQRMLEFYAIFNAMYADYHKAGRKFGVDKPEFYACLAKLWLEDPDAVDDKAGEYYAHVVKHE